MWQYLTMVLLVAVFTFLIVGILQFKKHARECVLNPEEYLIERMSKANDAGVKCVCITDSFPSASKEWYSEDYKFPYIDLTKIIDSRIINNINLSSNS